MHFFCLAICTCLVVICSLLCTLYACLHEKKRNVSIINSRKSAESLVFQEHYSDLQHCIQSPSTLAGVLYANKLVSRDIRNQVQQLNLTTDQKNSCLLNAVEQIIYCDPQKFHQFMDILYDEPTNRRLHAMIMENYSQQENIRSSRLVKRNALRTPALVKFDGYLSKINFQKLMKARLSLFYKLGHNKLHMTQMVSRYISSKNYEEDVQLFITIDDLLRFSVKAMSAKSLVQRCISCDCQNGFLLQAYAMVVLSDKYSRQGRTKKAFKYMEYCRSACRVVEPSYLSTLIFLTNARILIRKHKNGITPSIRSEILQLLDRAIQDSYNGNGWERYMICYTHLDKALFCLNGTISIDFNPAVTYHPFEEDILQAEKHLNAVPIDEFSEVNWIMAKYQSTLSDLKRLRGDMESARKQAQLSKHGYGEIGAYEAESLADARVKYLKMPNLH